MIEIKTSVHQNFYKTQRISYWYEYNRKKEYWVSYK